MPISQDQKQPDYQKLLDLIESRFGIVIEDRSPVHLSGVVEHYHDKRNQLLQRLGETAALQAPDYAKAVLISETAKMILREIRPRPRKRKKNRT